MVKTPPEKQKPMSERQKRFVDYYIQTGNAAKAARLAGFSDKSAKGVGKETLSRPAVQEAIKERLKELESERIAETREILEFLTSAMRGEVDEELTLMVGTGKGFSQIEKTRSQILGKERLKAAEMLAKINGMFVTRKELEITGSVPVVIHDDI